MVAGKRVFIHTYICAIKSFVMIEIQVYIKLMEGAEVFEHSQHSNHG